MAANANGKSWNGRGAIGALAGLICAGVALSASRAEGANASPPDFSGSGNVGWVTVDNKLIAPASGPGPVTDDPAYPHVRNDQSGQPNFRIADLGTNPNYFNYDVEPIPESAKPDF